MILKKKNILYTQYSILLNIPYYPKEKILKKKFTTDNLAKIISQNIFAFFFITLWAFFPKCFEGKNHF